MCVEFVCSKQALFYTPWMRLEHFFTGSRRIRGVSVEDENEPPGTVQEPEKVDSSASLPRSGPVFNAWTFGWLALGALGAITLFVPVATSPCVDTHPLEDSVAERAAWPLIFGASICFGAAVTVASRSLLTGLVASVGSFVTIFVVISAIDYSSCQ
jgi:hypothetical protein